MTARPAAAWTDVQTLYGLTIAADFPLHQRRRAHARRPDTVITTGPPIRPQVGPPEGEVLLDFQERDDHWYTLVRTTDGYLFRVYGLCEFAIAADLRRVRLSLFDGVESGMASVMTVGTLAALLLYLHGALVLHASAVRLPDGRAIAFLGRSGMGKSTLAALFCAAGSRLLTDDVLPIAGGQPVMVLPGATELRLRPGTGLDADRLNATGTRSSADAREVAQVGVTDTQASPLSAILVPWPNRDGRLELERITGRDALLQLLSFPRLLGWRDATVLQRGLAQARTVADSVPLFRAHVPWGPPFPFGLPERILRAVADRERLAPNGPTEDGSAGERLSLQTE